jgi:hypothetical protein
MADFQPELVLAAQQRIGATRAEARLAFRRWNAAYFVPGGHAVPRLARYRRILGRPAVDAAPLPGELRMSRTAWPLADAVWPGLWLEAIADGGGRVWHVDLVRAADAPGPMLRTAADLTPWSCTVAELAAAFGPVKYFPQDAPSRQPVGFTAPDESGHPQQWLARFVWGLLQTVQPVPG